MRRFMMVVVGALFVASAGPVFAEESGDHADLPHNEGPDGHPSVNDGHDKGGGDQGDHGGGDHSGEDHGGGDHGGDDHGGGDHGGDRDGP